MRHPITRRSRSNSGSVTGVLAAIGVDSASRKKGSRNHLRSFVNNLALQGITYVPQYMPLADYQAIVNAPMER
jgi:hypothetical protein